MRLMTNAHGISEALIKVSVEHDALGLPWYSTLTTLLDTLLYLKNSTNSTPS